MLVGDMVLRVRENLQDLDKDRCSDDRIRAALNLGILDMRRTRPDYFIGRYGEPTFQSVSVADAYPLPEITVPTIIKYATAWIEMSDDEVADEGRAAAMMRMFDADLGAKV